MKKLLLAVPLLIGSFAAARAQINLSLAPESTLRLEGDSTLHAYHSTATALSAVATAASLDPKGLQSLRVEVPVKSLKSGKSGLDKNMYKNLKADDHPLIVFELSHYTVKNSTVEATGRLSIAGVTNDVEIDAAASADADTVRFRGKKDLLMSDFGIKPPKMFLGALKTSDTVTIHFDIYLKKL